MLRIAGQTTGPIGLNFFVEIHAWPGGVIGYKDSNFFILNILFKDIFSNFFHGQRRALQLVDLYV